MKANEIIASIEAVNARSAWSKGVKEYALLIVENACVDEFPNDAHEVESILLNGASSWSAYSYGGSADIYDEDIAKTLCTPSELKRKRYGELPPNSSETWLDVQTRALCQAARLVTRTVRALAKDKPLAGHACDKLGSAAKSGVAA